MRSIARDAARDRVPAALRGAAALDAFRRIVQALRAGARDGERRAGLSSAQLFALQQIAEHPGASINDVAALTFTHQSSVSVVIQRLVAQRLVAKVAASRRSPASASRADRRRAGACCSSAPVAVQERLIAAIAALPAADRRALARSLGAVARRVTPRAPRRIRRCCSKTAGSGGSVDRRRPGIEKIASLESFPGLRSRPGEESLRHSGLRARGNPPAMLQASTAPVGKPPIELTGPARQRDIMARWRRGARRPEKPTRSLPDCCAISRRSSERPQSKWGYQRAADAIAAIAGADRIVPAGQRHAAQDPPGRTVVHSRHSRSAATGASATVEQAIAESGKAGDVEKSRGLRDTFLSRAEVLAALKTGGCAVRRSRTTAATCRCTRPTATAARRSRTSSRPASRAATILGGHRSLLRAADRPRRVDGEAGRAASRDRSAQRRATRGASG